MSSEDALRAEGFRPYIKNAIVWVKRSQESFILASDKGDLTGQAGDYLVTNGKGRYWPLAASVFDSSHEFANIGREDDNSQLRAEGYVPARKTAPVWAKQLTADEVIQTLEGARKASAGDWLAVGVQGERWPIPDDFFRENYTESE